jgi:hypothetical protein
MRFKSRPSKADRDAAAASPPVGTTDEPCAVDLSGLDGLSLYEKKCVLVNREIDRQGMGKYQWYVWGLCGFGYMIDLIWAQAFGLVLSPLQQELGFGNDRSGNISTSFNAGLTAGAFVWGILSDIVGEIYLFQAMICAHFSQVANGLST